MVDYWTPRSALVVAAHPDDNEFGVAGTVARWTDEGAAVTYLLLTNGASGSGDPAMTRSRLIELRAAEQRAAAKVLGVEHVLFLGHEDGLLTPSLELREQIVRAIRQVRPEVVVANDPAMRYFADSYINHPDHRAAGQAALDAVIPGSDTRLAYPGMLDEGLEPVSLTGVWLQFSDHPNLVVDIDATLERKLESLRCHVTQLGETPDLDFVRGWAEQAAAGQSFHYGEAFRVFRFRPEPPDAPGSEHERRRD